MFQCGFIYGSQVNLPAVFVANGLTLWLLIAVLYSEHRSLQTRSRDGKLFRSMCWLCLTLCVLETVGFVLDGRQFPGAREIALLCSAALMLMATGMAFLWVCYVDCKLFPDLKRLRKSWYFASLPVIAVAVLAMANLATPIFFCISETNHYARAAGYPIPWIVVYGYMIWGALRSYRYQRKADKHIFIPVMLFLLPAFIGSMIQFFCYGISLIWPSVALGLNLLYLNLQSERVFIDPLTKLYNRSYLLHYMDRITDSQDRHSPITGLMLDINNFKKINDTQGHTGGDAVLRAVGRILFQAAGDNIVVRYGGDEFIILVEGDCTDTIQCIREQISAGLRRYNASHPSLPPVSISGGVAVSCKGDMLRFFHEMDMKMYDEKRTFYAQEYPDETAASV